VFPDIAYLDWITRRPEQAEYDLGSSDLRRAPGGPGEVVPPALARDSPTADLAEDALSEDTPTDTAHAETPVNDEAPAETPVKAQLAGVYRVEPENVLLTAGATHANFLAIAATVSEAESDGEPGTGGGDEPKTPVRVLVEKPGYEPLIATPRGLGATVDRFRRPKAEDYQLDPDRIDAALVEDTALVTVTNRHNPSGRRASREELVDAASVVEDEGARLLVDEVYAPFDGEATNGPFGGPTAAGLPNTVVTNSLTKFFGFGGVRLGWLVADAEFVARARKVKHHVSAVAEPSERLARRALARAPELTAESRERIRTNHEMLAEFVAGREDLSGHVEPGCTYAFFEHESADGTEVSEAAWEQGVLVVPGRFFDATDRFRIAACRKPERIRAGLDRLSVVLDSLGD
jgi:aspartate/methionine/tyrosine aminotransferase